ncbi:AAA family ATPase [Komagataeibacter europaeus]|uniref:AAA family ATPase n=1 Tax=Komagataeibacter europaeus TaxID=33995 RepID=UPI0002E9FAEE|nr:DUF3696 domain-containing protein [Komagataeibacter europaeus]GBQ42661.1 hypothetical protein AA18890_1623 [Komagataeibacter europaeus LMG 18890]
MITDIHIEGFKYFLSDRVKIAPLTVLTGLNGSGKTSLIQAILLLCAHTRTKDTTVPLNGPYGLELGTADDVLNKSCKSDIKITIHDSQADKKYWELAIPNEDALYLNVLKQPPTDLPAFRSKARVFTFLSADRLGPRGVSQTSSLANDDLEIGWRGEFCPYVMSVLGDKILQHPERHHPSYKGSEPRLLKYEVEQWLSEITREIEINAERPLGTTIAQLYFRTSGAEWARATNMGFGITYALPIILGGLLAEPEGLFIVENPEAHLHPAGQSRMGVFLAWLAGTGVQVIIETHSDHILNGIRRAIAEYAYLDSEKAIFNYFGEETQRISNDSQENSKIEPLTITKKGNISNWPHGFFDQYQIDVASLGRIRRQKD